MQAVIHLTDLHSHSPFSLATRLRQPTGTHFPGVSESEVFPIPGSDLGWEGDGLKVDERLSECGPAKRDLVKILVGQPPDNPFHFFFFL